MRITILTYGSRGDVQPFVALAAGLRDAGHQVALAAPHRFESFVNSYNVPFVPLPGDPEVISRRLNDAGRNPIAMVRAMSDYIFSIAGQVARAAFAACERSELIVHSFLFTTGGHSLAYKLGVPDISVQTFPVFAPTRAFPPVSMPDMPPGSLSYLFHWLTTQIFWYGGNIGFGRLRKADPSTFNLELRWPFRENGNRFRTPLLLACSPTVLPRTDDWSDSHIHIPGYFFLDSPDSYRPPAELTDFLAVGEPPVCVSFGSMIHRDAERIYQVVLEALGKTGNRAVILSGWGRLPSDGSSEFSDTSGKMGDRAAVLSGPNNSSGEQSSAGFEPIGKTDIDAVVLNGWSQPNVEQSAEILVMDQVPHEWLLQRCKAMIHHGGAGTTGAGLRSGIPNVVVSFAADQPFWGARVHAIGAGPRPIPVKELTAEKLIAALAEADGEAIRNGARVAGRKIREENGVRVAVQLIEDYTARWRKSYKQHTGF